MTHAVGFGHDKRLTSWLGRGNIWLIQSKIRLTPMSVVGFFFVLRVEKGEPTSSQFVSTSVHHQVWIDYESAVVCFCFISWQHQRSSGWVLTCDSDFIVQPHWETRPLAPWPDFPLSHIIEPTSFVLILIMPNAWLESDKYTFLSHWLHMTRVQNHEVQIPRFYKTGDRRSTHSAIQSSHVMKVQVHDHHSVCEFWHERVFVFQGCRIRPKKIQSQDIWNVMSKVYLIMYFRTTHWEK